MRYVVILPPWVRELYCNSTYWMVNRYWASTAVLLWKVIVPALVRKLVALSKDLWLTFFCLCLPTEQVSLAMNLGFSWNPGRDTWCSNWEFKCLAAIHPGRTSLISNYTTPSSFHSISFSPFILSRTIFNKLHGAESLFRTGYFLSYSRIFPHFVKQVFHFFFHNSSPLAHILSQINPVEASVLVLEDSFNIFPPWRYNPLWLYFSQPGSGL